MSIVLSQTAWISAYERARGVARTREASPKSQTFPVGERAATPPRAGLFAGPIGGAFAVATMATFPTIVAVFRRLLAVRKFHVIERDVRTQALYCIDTQPEWQGDRRLHAEIRTGAQTFGFDAVGITRAQADPRDRNNLTQYVAEGRHGDMDWLGREIERRSDPQALWPEARSIICVGVNYGPAVDPLGLHEEPERGAISVYARGRDYHDVLKKRLKAFGRWLAATYACEVKVFIDTAPVMEKPLAMRAGLGWIGKHTNLVSRRFGSWLFLGEVFTTLDLAPDPPEVDHCGSCDACVRACPTGALSEPYRIEPRRCIAYLTVEHKGEVPKSIADLSGNRIFGCDDCLAACPWNKFATPTPHLDLQPRSALTAPRLKDLAQLDEAGFKELFAGTPIRRTGHQRMMRNVRIAADNQHTTLARRSRLTHRG